MTRAEIGGATDAAPRAGLDPLEGRWRVERLGGLLPPMLGMTKEIRRGRGTVQLGPLRGPSFQVQGRGESTRLVYNPPLSALVDELRTGPESSWMGLTLFSGHELGRFRMTRVRD